ncbi:MAG: mandelate racemase/muconate lactonizing enzyme family protein [Eubacteriales bacterium]|jgi:L-alanine-DL-glutamate epimerase-like enolase superfamily enzyme|nr:mandelate racemase/muconate lactonizing enzyme family protein [Eubacteriales bacterium]MDD3290577.1 mandelate racemase/muconate lactonizing enzyme family protein [Eubacteriales bacterium]MDD3864097.1 mandelate racemase/muconate lactonizing enzyme family protein [Eubacteriales bacterium]MDD4445320.1 mandelate racemase/muconate lactonizing enzyme family protein [Eubacteriales bacterium]
MKIIDVKLQLAEIPLKEPYPSTWNPGNPETKLFVSLAEVITDDGIHGYGAACDSSQLLAGIWESHIKPLLIGRDITEIEAISTGLVNAAQYAYRPWIVEIACWDALGKYCNLPIYKMLGGAQDRVLAYASTGSLKTVDARMEDMERFISEGFHIMKVRAHHDDPREDLEIIGKIVEKAAGRIDIAVDANQAWFFTGKRSVAKWDLKRAIQVARELEEMNVLWLEEPLHQFDYEGLAELRQSTSLNIAGGEINSHLHQFRDFIKYGCYDIYQTDPTFCGGFHIARKIVGMIEAENKLFSPHTWTHGMGLAASLQIAASTSACPFIEYCYDPPYWEYTTRDIMLKEPIKVDADGYITVSQAPGLGVEPDLELLDKYTILRK